jgi:4-amino-4-deoxy-L-arabinose transferase-like glycosyltransferase
MSQPYGAPQQQPGPAQPAVGVNLTLILPLVAAGLALIAYLLAFADDVPSSEYLYAAGILAGLSVLPKAPRGLLYAAVPFAVIPTLGLLQGLITTDADVQGMQIVLLIVSLLLAAAVVLSLLLDTGIVKLQPKTANVYGQPGGWNPHSGAFQQQGQQPQQFGPPSGQFGQQAPPQAQQPQPGQPQPTSYMPQPGQFGQPGQQPGQGTPPSGFGGPQQG